jgi:negative regulator of sigma E activity
MPDEHKPGNRAPDELDEYLSEAGGLSRQYRREFAPMPPHALDRRVLHAARQRQPKSQTLAPLAFAASVLLSVALVLAIVFAPQAARKMDDMPHVVKVRSTQAPEIRERTPAAWLADIEALRRAGRTDEADAEMRLFHRIYPDYAAAKNK